MFTRPFLNARYAAVAAESYQMARCCQSNGNWSPRGRKEPKPNSRLGEDCLPGGQCGGSSLLVDCPADEMAFLSEVVVD